MLVFFFPETSSNTILLKRAKRLRKRTGNENLKSESEIQSSQMTGKDIAMMTLVLPIWMSISEPICFFLNRKCYIRYLASEGVCNCWWCWVSFSVHRSCLRCRWNWKLGRLLMQSDRAFLKQILYVWIESFQLVFVQIYGFNLGENGLAYLGVSC